MTFARLAVYQAGHNNLLILDAYWFNATGIVGVVVCEDTISNKIKCYIEGINGGDYTEIQDAQRVILHGAHFPIEAAKILFPHLDFDSSWVKEHPEYYL